MALPETRMKLAVRLAERALRAAPSAPMEARIDAFRSAYETVALAAGAIDRDDDWAEDTLNAAWDLAADAFPDGGTVESIAEGFIMAHTAIVSTAESPQNDPRQPSRPRRDA